MLAACRLIKKVIRQGRRECQPGGVLLSTLRSSYDRERPRGIFFISLTMDIQDFLVQGEGREEDKRQAWDLFQQAYEQQMKRELEEAVNLYKKSLATHPTAEAYTFLGWTYSWTGRIDEAIDECHKAIAQDPDFGNPYNDIGAYLI